MKVDGSAIASKLFVDLKNPSTMAYSFLEFLGYLRWKLWKTVTLETWFGIYFFLRPSFLISEFFKIVALRLLIAQIIYH